ncbi:hypothetical protein NDU88_003922, partial [Pleurodeles waltl]
LTKMGKRKATSNPTEQGRAKRAPRHAAENCTLTQIDDLIEEVESLLATKPSKSRRKDASSSSNVIKSFFAPVHRDSQISIPQGTSTELRKLEILKNPTESPNLNLPNQQDGVSPLPNCNNRFLPLVLPSPAELERTISREIEKPVPVIATQDEHLAVF